MIGFGFFLASPFSPFAQTSPNAMLDQSSLAILDEGGAALLGD